MRTHETGTRAGLALTSLHLRMKHPPLPSLPSPCPQLKALLLPFLLLAVLLMVDPPDELPDVDVATERSRPMLPWRVVRYGVRWAAGARGSPAHLTARCPALP